MCLRCTLARHRRCVSLCADHLLCLVSPRARESPDEEVEPVEVIVKAHGSKKVMAEIEIAVGCVIFSMTKFFHPLASCASCEAHARSGCASCGVSHRLTYVHISVVRLTPFIRWRTTLSRWCSCTCWWRSPSQGVAWGRRVSVSVVNLHRSLRPRCSCSRPCSGSEVTRGRGS